MKTVGTTEQVQLPLVGKQPEYPAVIENNIIDLAFEKKERIKEAIEDCPDDIKNSILKFGLHKAESSKEWLRNHYPKIINTMAAGIHTMAASAPFMGASNKFVEFSNTVAIGAAKWFVPLTTLGQNAFEAWKGKRMVEAAIRLIPVVILPMVPFYNFSIGFGIYSACNFLLGKATKGIELKEKDGWKVNFEKTFKGLETFLEEIFEGVGHLAKDFGQNGKATIGKLLKTFVDEKARDTKLGKFTDNAFSLACAMGMFFPSVFHLVFARKERDTTLAKTLGFVRNLSGLGGDANIMVTGDKFEKTAGGFMGVASILGILQRFIPDEKVARIFIHTLMALDNIGMTVWALDSQRKNDKQSLSKLLEHFKIDPGILEQPGAAKRIIRNKLSDLADGLIDSGETSSIAAAEEVKASKIISFAKAAAEKVSDMHQAKAA